MNAPQGDGDYLRPISGIDGFQWDPVRRADDDGVEAVDSVGDLQGPLGSGRSTTQVTESAEPAA